MLYQVGLNCLVCIVKVPTVGLVYTMWVYHDVWALNTAPEVACMQTCAGVFCCEIHSYRQRVCVCMCGGAVTHYRSCDPYSKELGI